MTENEQIETPERVRVSIAERLVPALGFGVAALGGVIGMWQVRALFNSLRTAETAGFASFFGWLSEIDAMMAAVLVFAAVLGVAGIGVSAVRLFIKPKTASPGALLMLLMSAVGLLPPVLIALGLRMTVSAISNPASGGIAMVAETVSLLTIAAAVVGVLGGILLLVLSVVPFRARLGRRPATLIILILAEFATVALAGWYLVDMLASRQEMMRH